MAPSPDRANNRHFANPLHRGWERAGGEGKSAISELIFPQITSIILQMATVVRKTRKPAKRKRATVADMEKLALPAASLRRLAKKHPAPQEWYDQDQTRNGKRKG